MRFKLTIVGASLALALSAVVAARVAEMPEVASSPSDPMPNAAATPSGYASLLAEIDARIASLQTRADDRPGDWLVRMHLGTALLDRAGLTHDVDDYDRLQRVLDEAFGIAPEGSGPLLLAARFEVSIHRLEVAEALLDRMDRRALKKRDELWVARSLRAQIAVQRGEIEQAIAELREVATVMPAAADAELALVLAKTGAPDEADALLLAALASASPDDARRRAWTTLQRGLLALDRGAHLQALELLQAADAELSGWWLVQEHLAEVHHRLGQHGRAIAILEALVREHGMAQHMDALATAYRHAGRETEAAQMVQRAAAGWAELRARYPEAAMGHGLAHELQHGDPQTAVELAEANVAARPGGDAQVALATAYLAAGRPTDALAVVRRTLATPYRTARLHRVAAQAFAGLGDPAAAMRHRALCIAINPSCEAQPHTH